MSVVGNIIARLGGNTFVTAFLVVVYVVAVASARSLALYSGRYCDISADNVQLTSAAGHPVVQFTLTATGKDGFLPGSFDGVFVDGLVNQASGISGSIFFGGSYDSYFLDDSSRAVIVNTALIPGFTPASDSLTGIFALYTSLLAESWDIARIYAEPSSEIELSFTIGQPGTNLTQWVKLSFVAAYKGDANLDGTVDLDDFVILKQNYGTRGAAWQQGDFNGDGDVNLDDFVLLKQNYGQVAPAGTVRQGYNAIGKDAE